MKKEKIALIIGISLIITLLSSCVSVNEYYDVETSGDVKSRIEIISEYKPVLQGAEKQMLESNMTSVYYEDDETLIGEGYLKENVYSFKDNGNFFKHDYVFIMNHSLRKVEESEEYPEYFRGIHVNMPGKPYSVSSDCRRSVDNSDYEVTCDYYEDMIIKSSCYFIFC